MNKSIQFQVWHVVVTVAVIVVLFVAVLLIRRWWRNRKSGGLGVGSFLFPGAGIAKVGMSVAWKLLLVFGVVVSIVSLALAFDVPERIQSLFGGGEKTATAAITVADVKDTLWDSWVAAQSKDWEAVINPDPSSVESYVRKVIKEGGDPEAIVLAGFLRDYALALSEKNWEKAEELARAIETMGVTGPAEYARWRREGGSPPDLAMATEATPTPEGEAAASPTPPGPGETPVPEYSAPTPTPGAPPVTRSAAPAPTAVAPPQVGEDGLQDHLYPCTAAEWTTMVGNCVCSNPTNSKVCGYRGYGWLKKGFCNPCDPVQGAVVDLLDQFAPPPAPTPTDTPSSGWVPPGRTPVPPVATPVPPVPTVGTCGCTNRVAGALFCSDACGGRAGAQCGQFLNGDAYCQGAPGQSIFTPTPVPPTPTRLPPGPPTIPPTAIPVSTVATCGCTNLVAGALFCNDACGATKGQLCGPLGEYGDLFCRTGIVVYNTPTPTPRSTVSSF